jgi:hypothetical protein
MSAEAPSVDVILPVLDEAQALPWVLGACPTAIGRSSPTTARPTARRASPPARGAAWSSRPGAASAPPASPACGRATAPVVCFMDCDGSLDPLELPRIAAPGVAGRADLVLGARWPTAGAWPLHARVANAVLARQVRSRTGLALTDLGPMRAAPREALIALEIRDRRFGWPLEMVLRAHAAGWRIAEDRVRYRPREGRSKVTGTVRGTLRTVRDMRSALS